MIKRVDFKCQHCRSTAVSEVNHPNGYWCRWSDVEPLLKRIEVLECHIQLMNDDHFEKCRIEATKRGEHD